jgi:hypothetical protein
LDRTRLTAEDRAFLDSLEDLSPSTPD